MSATTADEKPRRAVTDAIIVWVHYAKETPGRWVELDHAFQTRSNAHSTASCVRRGFLRVRPKPGEKAIAVGEHTYLKLPAKCEVKIKQEGEFWRLWLRAPQRHLRVVRKKAAV